MALVQQLAPRSDLATTVLEQEIAGGGLMLAGQAAPADGQTAVSPELGELDSQVAGQLLGLVGAQPQKEGKA